MKIFWKMFLSMIGIVTIVFSIFGSWLLFTSFQTTLDGELRRSESEKKLFLYAFEASLEILPENYENKEEEIKEIVSTIKKSSGQNQSYIKVYNQENKIIYKEESPDNSIVPKNLEEKSNAYIIHETNHRHYLEMMSCVSDATDTYYVDIMRDIQNLYDDRAELYRQYKFALLITLCVAGLLSYLLSRRISRPVVALSDTVKKMSEGKYDVRADVLASGEVGTLAEDFNSMAEQIEKNIDELEDAARKQEDFTASFAHELKTPLTSIVGYSDMIRSMELTEKETREYANYIFVQGKRLEKLSYSLMNYIILEKGKEQLIKINPKDMDRVIKSTMSPIMKKKEIMFRVDMDPGMILGDYDLLLSLFHNLLDNARKAVDIRGTVLMKGKSTEKGYLVTVQDNGCGMEASEIKKITEAFYMIDKSRARKEGGAGIGMALCKKIVQIHHAKMSARSTPGEGTSIYVLFPKVPQNEE